MNIIFFGTPEFVIPVLTHLQSNHTIQAVVTAPDMPKGRTQHLTATPVKSWAIQHQIPVITPERLNDETIDALNKLQPDYIIVAAYGKLIPDRILKIPKFGALNIHPSRLPQFRGPSPIQASILAGITDSAVSIIQMDEQMDHGPIIKTIPFQIQPVDTFSSLAIKTFQLAATQIPQILEELVSGTIQPNMQQDEHATYCFKITKQDGFIDLHQPPSREFLMRKIHAFYPWPLVWSRIQIGTDERIIKFLPEKSIQLEGKNPVPLETFYRGYPQLMQLLQQLFD